MLLLHSVASATTEQRETQAIRQNVLGITHTHTNGAVMLGLMSWNSHRPMGRFRPNNDGADNQFTRNWTGGTDKKIPWPVKKMVALIKILRRRMPERPPTRASYTTW